MNPKRWGIPAMTALLTVAMLMLLNGCWYALPEKEPETDAPVTTVTGSETFAGTGSGETSAEPQESGTEDVSQDTSAGTDEAGFPNLPEDGYTKRY